MKSPGANSLKKICSKGLFAILLLAGFFVFHHSAAASRQQFAKQTTEYVQSGTYLTKGLKYPASPNNTYKRPINGLFFNANLSLFHSKQTFVNLKVTQQTVLNKPVYSYFYFIKSIPQSGKSDSPAILG